MSTAQIVGAFMIGFGFGVFVGMLILRRVCNRIQEQNARLLATWTPKPETLEEAIAELRRQR